MFLYNWLKKAPLQILISLLFSFCFGSTLSTNTIRLLYTLSYIFIEVLLFFLPLIIFVYIFSSVINMDRRSPLLAGFLLISITLSNFLALFTSYSLSYFCLPLLQLPALSKLVFQSSAVITPLFTLNLPNILSTDKTLLAGFSLGLSFIFLNKDQKITALVQQMSLKVRDYITLGLQKIFVPLLPLYILGFSLKLSYEGSLVFLFKNYTQVFLLSCATVIVYLALLYAIASKLNWHRFFNFIKVMLPAGLTGASTMSSAATMPFTLEATQQNTKDSEFSQFVIPSTANIHMLGDDLTIVLTAMTILIMEGHPLPDLFTFLMFSGAFCFAKLSCVGIPGASVLVVLPVLEQFLGFSPSMISLLTTIYILQDPLGTFTNVMGNGAFAIITRQALQKIKILKPLQEEHSY